MGTWPAGEFGDRTDCSSGTEIPAELQPPGVDSSQSQPEKGTLRGIISEEYFAYQTFPCETPSAWTNLLAGAFALAAGNVACADLTQPTGNGG